MAMGERNAAYYHLFLMAAAIVLTIVFTLLNLHSVWQWLFLLCSPLLVLNLKKVFTYKNGTELYSELPRVSMATLVFSLMLLLGVLL